MFFIANEANAQEKKVFDLHSLSLLKDTRSCQWVFPHYSHQQLNWGYRVDNSKIFEAKLKSNQTPSGTTKQLLNSLNTFFPHSGYLDASRLTGLICDGNVQYSSITSAWSRFSSYQLEVLNDGNAISGQHCTARTKMRNLLSFSSTLFFISTGNTIAWLAVYAKQEQRSIPYNATASIDADCFPTCFVEFCDQALSFNNTTVFTFITSWLLPK